MNVDRLVCHWLRRCRCFRRRKVRAEPLAPYKPNHGFTLLEIILSLAILAGALAALGEVMRLADQNAANAEDETQAQILAASLMDELVAGSRDLTAVSQALFDEDTDPIWVYSIDLEPTPYDELIAVRVRVEQNLDPRLQPVHFELVRWLPNPDFTPADTGDQQSDSSNSSSSAGAGGQP